MNFFNQLVNFDYLQIGQFLLQKSIRTWSTGDYDIVSGGSTRIKSVFNGLQHIKEQYRCNKVVIVDAVRPLLYADLLDDYFDKLDYYDAVITAKKITGGFTDIYDNNLDREKYIITQSPEGFRFELLWKNYNLNFKFQEIAGMLPKGSKRYYNFDFTNNLKLTYDYELAYAEYLLKHYGENSCINNAVSGKSQV